MIEADFTSEIGAWQPLLAALGLYILAVSLLILEFVIVSMGLITVAAFACCSVPTIQARKAASNSR